MVRNNKTKETNGSGSRVTEITVMETMEAKGYKCNKGIVKEVEDDKKRGEENKEVKPT